MSSTSATVREWRWVDEPSPRRIPGNWSDQGVEPLENGEEHWYAVAYKPGTQLLWSVDQDTGEPVDRPHREDRRIAVLYVRGDATRAIVRDYRAEKGSGGWIPCPQEYLSVRSFSTGSGGPTSPRKQREYEEVLVEMYGIDPLEDRIVRGRGSA